MISPTFIPKCLLLALLVFPFSATAKTLRFAAMDYCPITCAPSKENGKEGAMIDILRAAFEEVGYKVEYDILPFSRLLHMAKEGKYDGVAGIGKIHDDHFIFEDTPVFIQPMVFMVKPETEWRYTGYRSLYDITLLIIHGYDYAEGVVNKYVLENADSEKIVLLHGFDTTERGLRMLKAGRVGAYIEGEFNVLYHIKKYNFEGSFIAAGYTSRSYGSYTAFSYNLPDGKMLAKILTSKVKSLRKSGKLDDILANYGVHIRNK